MLTRSVSALHLTDGDISFRKSLITNHDVDILSLVSRGYDDRQIAQQLSDNEQAITQDLTMLCLKLGVKDRLELVLSAIRYGLVKLESECLREASRNRRT